jgi:hypothetical protein
LKDAIPQALIGADAEQFDDIDLALAVKYSPKNSGGARWRCASFEREAPALPVSRQCRLLSVSGASVYRRPAEIG